MKKLNNWNSWCNDKAVFTGTDGEPIIVSPNALIAIEGTKDYTELYFVEGYCFTVKETPEEILGTIGELIEESKARQEAAAAEARKMYETMKPVEAGEA